MQRFEQEQLSPQGRRLIALLRSMGSGELHILVKDHQPVRAEQIQKEIPLGR